MEGPPWIDKELREVLYKCTASKSWILYLMWEAKCKNYERHKPGKGSCKGLVEGDEREKKNVQILFKPSVTTLKKTMKKDFLQILPFYFQLCSCWLFLLKGCMSQNNVWPTKHIWCAHNILAFNKTFNNSSKRQDFPLEKADLLFVCYLKIFPYPFTCNNVTK